MLVIAFMFLNLFIAIILQGFSDTSERMNMKIKESDIEQFIKTWSKFDPAVSQIMTMS